MVPIAPTVSACSGAPGGSQPRKPFRPPSASPAASFLRFWL